MVGRITDKWRLKLTSRSGFVKQVEVVVSGASLTEALRNIEGVLLNRSRRHRSRGDLMYELEYRDNGKRVVLTLTERDLREWLDQWPDYVGPDAITLRKVG